MSLAQAIADAKGSTKAEVRTTETFSSSPDHPWSLQIARDMSLL